MTLLLVSALYLLSGQVLYIEKPMENPAACQAIKVTVKKQVKPELGVIFIAACLQVPSL